MTRRNRILGLLFVLVVVCTAKLAGQIYRWYAYADERTQLQAMRTALEDAAIEVVRTQLGADSLRREIRGMDKTLEEAREAVRGFELPEPPIGSFLAYDRELTAYNGVVAERNARFQAWREVVMRNHHAVDEFNDLADRMRAVADRMGEQYVNIPTPAEVAAAHGLLQLDP